MLRGWRISAEPVSEERLTVPVVYMAQRMVRNQYGAPVPNYDITSCNAHEPERTVSP